MSRKIPILSVLFHPLLIPTYGMLLLNAATARVLPLAPVYWCISLTGTFFFTCAFSGTYIVIMRLLGRISSVYLTKREERTAPYVVTLVGMALWCYFLQVVLHVPSFAVIAAIGGTLALVLVSLINLKWKISAHLTGFGALIGGVVGYGLQMGIFPFYWLLGLLLTALLLMYERIYLQAHDGLQVVAGFLLGLTLTAGPCFIYFQ